MGTSHRHELCLSQHGAWGPGPPPWTKDEGSVRRLWGGQHASAEEREPQHEIVAAEAAAEEGVDEGAGESSQPTLYRLQRKVKNILQLPGSWLWKCELNLSSTHEKLTLQWEVKGHDSSLCLCTISLTKLSRTSTSWFLVLSGRWQDQFCESNLLKVAIGSSSSF